MFKRGLPEHISEKNSSDDINNISRKDQDLVGRGDEFEMNN